MVAVVVVTASGALAARRAPVYVLASMGNVLIGAGMSSTAVHDYLSEATSEEPAEPPLRRPVAPASNTLATFAWSISAKGGCQYTGGWFRSDP